MSAIGITLYVIGTCLATASLVILVSMWCAANFHLTTKPKWSKARVVMMEGAQRIFGPSMVIMGLYLAGCFEVRSFADVFRYTPTVTTEYDLLLVIHVLIFLVITEFLAVVNVVKDSAFLRGFLYAAVGVSVYIQGTFDNVTYFVLSSVAIGILCFFFLGILMTGHVNHRTLIFTGVTYFLYAACFLLFGLLRGPNVGNVTDFIYMLLDVIFYGGAVFIGLIAIIALVPFIADKDGNSMFFHEGGASRVETMRKVRNLGRRI